MNTLELYSLKSLSVNSSLNLANCFKYLYQNIHVSLF